MKFCLFIIFLFVLNIATVSQNASAASFSVGGLRMDKKVRSMKEIKEKNIVRQSLDYSCGAAGLSTILNYYLKNPFSEKEIISTILQTVDLEKVKQRKGFSLLDLKRVAQAKGYKVTGYKMDIDFLRELGKPTLVPIKFKDYQHFVIVKSVLGDRVFIADPATGNMTMKINRFNSIWLEGIGLVIENENQKEFSDYPLEVAKEEAIIADYRNIKRLIDRSLIRTAIFTNEYK